MHIGKLVYRGKDSVITAQNIDINWSPLQYFSEGLAISELHVAALTVQSLGPSEPAKMPESLAAPFRLSLSDARLDKLTLVSESGTNVIENVRFELYGDKTSWHLQEASAKTPFGNAKADLTIAANKPFALQGKASLTQSIVPAAKPAAGAKPVPSVDSATAIPAQLNVTAAGSLALLNLKAQGEAGPASGDATLSLAPFDPIILRAIDLTARDVNPAGFEAGLRQVGVQRLLGGRAGKRDVAGHRRLVGAGVQVAQIETVGVQLEVGDIDACLGALALDVAAAGEVAGRAQVEQHVFQQRGGQGAAQAAAEDLQRQRLAVDRAGLVLVHQRELAGQLLVRRDRRRHLEAELGRRQPGLEAGRIEVARGQVDGAQDDRVERRQRQGDVAAGRSGFALRLQVQQRQAAAGRHAQLCRDGRGGRAIGGRGLGAGRRRRSHGLRQRGLALQLSLIHI